MKSDSNKTGKPESLRKTKLEIVSTPEKLNKREKKALDKKGMFCDSSSFKILIFAKF
jgi:hypothetical protein